MHALLDHFEESHVVIVGADGQPVSPPSPSQQLDDTEYDEYDPHSADYASSSRVPVASIVIDYPKPPPLTQASFADLPFGFLGIDADAYASGDDDGGETKEFASVYPDITDPYDPFGFEASRAFVGFDLDAGSSTTTGTATTAATPAMTVDASSTFSSPCTSAVPSPAPNPTCLPPALLSAADSHRVQEPYAIPSSFSRVRFEAPAPSYVFSPLSSTPLQVLPYTPPPPPPSSSSYSSSSSFPSSLTAPRLLPKHQKQNHEKQKLKRESTHQQRAKQKKAKDERREREKTFRCPNEACAKRYLNPNGLKYHLEKGRCTAGVRVWEASGVGGFVVSLGGAGGGIGGGGRGGGEGR